MVSEELRAKLSVKIDAWVSSESIPQPVADRVLDIALSEPQSERDVRTYCEEHMLSTALVEWYNKFLDYLSKQTDSETSQETAAFTGDVIETARRFRDALNMFLEKYDVH